MTTNDPAERKLKRVKIALLRDDEFAYWRGVMMIGKTELSDTFPTAATDGCNEVYGRRLVDMLTEKMLADRWACSVLRLQHWCTVGEGPPYLK